jgi:hypothetical protein
VGLLIFNFLSCKINNCIKTIIKEIKKNKFNSTKKPTATKEIKRIVYAMCKKIDGDFLNFIEVDFNPIISSSLIS